MVPILGYWDIRGLAQPIRHVLAYTGTEYEDKMYDNTDRNPWFNVKFNLGFDFPNLPYYIDKDVKLTQNIAIIRYIARKHNLMGTTEQEKARVDLMECQISDFRNEYQFGLVYNPNYANLKEGYLKALPAKLKAFSDFLGSNPFFAGKNLTYVDFIAYEMFHQHKSLEPKCLEPHNNLEQFTKRIEALPAISAYMRSDKYMRRPFNGKIAGFGGEP